MSVQVQISPPSEPVRVVTPSVEKRTVPPRKRRWWLWLLGIAVLAAGGFFALRGHGNPQAAASSTKTKRTEPEAVVVTVEPVTHRLVQRTVQVVGTFLGFEEIIIAPKSEGKISRVLHDIGDKVRPGDTLLEIDETDYKLAEAEAQRALDLELARLGLTELPGTDFDIKKLPSVIRAESILLNAESKLRRLKASGSGVSREEMEQGETDRRVADANHRQAEFDAQSTLAAVRHRQALLETARQRLQDTKLVTPAPSKERLRDLQMLPKELVGDRSAIEFVVAQRMANEGEMAKANPPTSMFRLVMDHPLKMQATLPERYSGEVKTGQKVQINVEAYPKETFQGWVGRVNPTVSQANRTFQVEVLIPNADRRLRAGSFAKGAVLTRDEPAPMVPEESLVTFAGVTKVYVLRNNKAVAVPVTTDMVIEVKDGNRIRNWVEIKGDLKPGEPVVTSGQTKVVDGGAMKIRGSKSIKASVGP